MSAIEETKQEISVPTPAKAQSAPPAGASGVSSPLMERALTLLVGVVLVILLRVFAGDAMSSYDVAGLLLLTVGVAAVGIQKMLDYLSSVRFGVSLLVLLVIACMIGMLIMQVNVDGFENYYAELTPSQKLLYGSLNFFDIYHSRYFNFLLLILSLNIVLASIDRFPKAWTFISRKKLDASAHWLRGQEQHASLRLEAESRSALAERISEAFRGAGLKPVVTEKNGKSFVFGERGVWNRLGAYAVHVALLTIFAGGFLTAQFSRVGQMPLKPGMSANEMSEVVFRIDGTTGEFAPTRASAELPFEVVCTDIQQQLIRKEGPITADNTLDWLTRIKIKDETGERDALVHMNRPYDYRGYRFFQASFQSLGQARQITLSVTPEQGGTPLRLTIKRDGEATLPDGTRIAFQAFFPDFVLGARGPDTASDEYNKPAAMLSVTPSSGGAPERVFALSSELLKNAPVAGKAVAGYKFRLEDFEKVPLAHVLSIQKDPGANVVYLGFLLLALTLAYVFFVSHQRVWALVEERGAAQFDVTLGGNTNRNHLGFEDRFKRLVSAIKGEPSEAAASEQS
ncbi:MAG TPA: cytochrome c biogenesis protein ResB [Pyrinomonadaceae bacterium]|jgi:cytochrome c biogenesis protein